MTASRPGRPRAHASIEDAYRAHAIPTTDGHMRWTGPSYGHGRAPMVQHVRERESAYRVAFRLHHDRAPEGMLKPVCGVRGCVAGAHLEDAAMRRAKNSPRPHRKPGPAGVPRSEIVALLAEGHTDRYIVRTLQTSHKRVRDTRAMLGLPPVARTALPVEVKWSTYARPLDGGHFEWTGPKSRYGTPVLRHRETHLPAAAVAFRQQHGRDPVGYVKAGCDMAQCVAPAHVEDRPMREALRNQLNQIFGKAA